MEKRTGSVAVNFALPAERLRMKGQTVRITGFDGAVSDYRVTNVSDPDETGTVHLSVEETA